MTDDADNHYTSYTRDRKKCSGTTCKNMIPKKDDFCTQCYHLEVTGDLPKTRIMQYVGGASVFE